MSPEDFIPKLAETSRKMRGIPIMRDKPVDLIKRGKAGLENLLISTYPKRRFREKAMRDYRKKRGSKTSVAIEHCTDYYSVPSASPD
jgi:hypothetical protein